jgi:hypothetical protein
MNEFEPKKLNEASKYLQNKLDLFKKGGAYVYKNAYKLEDRKSTMFQRFVDSIFHK